MFFLQDEITLAAMATGLQIIFYYQKFVINLEMFVNQ